MLSCKNAQKIASTPFPFPYAQITIVLLLMTCLKSWLPKSRPIDRSIARSIARSFVCSLARSRFFFQKTACVAVSDLVEKSSKSEPSSQFFGRLKLAKPTFNGANFSEMSLFVLAQGIIRAMQSMFWVLVLTIVALYRRLV